MDPLPVLLGGAVGAGLWLVVRELVPVQPDLKHALDHLGTQRPTAPTAPAHQPNLKSKVGAMVHTRTGDHAPWVRIPRQDLAVLQVSTHQWLGEKVLLALIGLLAPSLVTAVFSAVGLRLPLALPAAVSLAAAVAFFFLPDLAIKRKAARQREVFARCVGAYLELVALQRKAGRGPRQALEEAAVVARSWPFERIREQLLRAHLAGQQPWAGLEELATELGVPQLADLADIMRRAGTTDTAVYTALRARGRSLRNELLSAEHARANAASVQMIVPATVCTLLLVLILAIPAAIRIF